MHEEPMPASYEGEFLGGAAEPLRIPADGNDLVDQAIRSAMTSPNLPEPTMAQAQRRTVTVENRASPSDKPSSIPLIAQAPTSQMTTSSSIVQPPKAQATPTTDAQHFAKSLKQRLLRSTKDARLSQAVASVRSAIAKVRGSKSRFGWSVSTVKIEGDLVSYLGTLEDEEEIRGVLLDLAILRTIKDMPRVENQVRMTHRRVVFKAVRESLVPAVDELSGAFTAAIDREAEAVSSSKAKLIASFGKMLGISDQSKTGAESGISLLREELRKMNADVKYQLGRYAGPTSETASGCLGPIEAFLRE